LSSKVRTCWS